MNKLFTYLTVFVLLLSSCAAGSKPTVTMLESKTTLREQILVPTNTPILVASPTPPKKIILVPTPTPPNTPQAILVPTATEEADQVEVAEVVTETSPITVAMVASPTIDSPLILIFPIPQSRWPQWKSWYDGKLCLNNVPEQFGPQTLSQIDGFKVFNIKQDIYLNENRIQIIENTGTTMHLDEAFGCHEFAESPREKNTAPMACFMLGNIPQACIVFVQREGTDTVFINFLDAFPELAR